MTDRATLLPFYALCDVSASMAEDGRIGALNDALAATCDAAAANPVIADRIRLAVVTLSADAELTLPLCDLGLLERVPRLEPRGLTCYGPAFALLRRTIEDDVALLVADGYRVFRPAVFFLTDGLPTDPSAVWRPALARLVDEDFPHRPNIVAFGFGDADAAVTAAVSTVGAYAATDAVTAAAAIASFGALLVESVVTSGAAGRFRLPADVPGLSPVELEEDLL
jgi:uncharacterized protein YegL